MNINIKSSSLNIRELHKNDRVNLLSLGKQELTSLKTFLKKSALDFHHHNIAKTYVLVDHENSPRVWGYVSLMCSEIFLNNSQRPNHSKNVKRYDTFPALKLARLAVDKELQGKGYGLLLVTTAIAIMKDHVMPKVGCRFLTVDSKPDAISFYEKLGFNLLISDENKQSRNPLMLLDMHNVK